MDRFFDANNPIMRFLSRLVDLVWLNILTLVCMIPVVTIGASLTAMNYVTLHQVMEEDTYTHKMFFRSFRDNIRQGIPMGLLYTAFVLVAGTDLLILHRMDSRVVTAMMLIITVVSCFILATAVYAFGLLARYENTLAGTLRNALQLTLGHLPRTLAMMVTWLLWTGALVYLHKAAPLAILLYGFSLPGYVCTILYEPIFRKMEAE